MIVKTKKTDLLTYLEDTSNLSGSISAVYIPKDQTELRELIASLRLKKIPFTLSGGRTGTTGGCIPKQGVVISLEEFKAIKTVDLLAKTIAVQAGVSLAEVEAAANKLNLTLPAHPTESLALVGGVVSTAASGVRGFGCGGIRNYVKEIEVLLVSGEILKITRGNIFAKQRTFDFELAKRSFNFKLPSYSLPNCKSQAGYFVKDDMDLIDLFIGSEGTLGIVTDCVLALKPLAYQAFDGLLFFSQADLALDFVKLIQELSLKREVSPVSLEFFDEKALNLLRTEYPFIPQGSSGVYFEQEAETEASYQPLLDRWQELIEQSQASIDNSIFADRPAERERVFEIRHKLPQLINEFLRRHKQTKVASDIAVPKDKFALMYQNYCQIARYSKVDYLNFGHIGESHLHFNFLPVNDQQQRLSVAYLKKLCQQAVSLGGTVSAEHGIGKLKKPYLRLMYNDQQIREMAQLKKYFDPDCLLGLDNIFDQALLGAL